MLRKWIEVAKEDGPDFWCPWLAVIVGGALLVSGGQIGCRIHIDSKPSNQAAEHEPREDADATSKEPMP
jgi:hypothetical protein